MTTPSGSGQKPSAVVDFEDVKLLVPLFGEHDVHLARIERQLGVTLLPRGNRVAIVGDEGMARVAKDALGDLYQRLRQGLDVAPADVDAAIRMAEAEPVRQVSSENGKQMRRPSTVDEDAIVRTQKRIITPRSPTQADYVRALHDHDLVIGLGPAGTGKTYLAVAVAVSKLLSGEVDRIILTRPAVEAGERLGFLPGALEEKVDPYMRPMYDALYDMMPGERVMKRRDAGEIEIAPLAYMRGRTLSNAFVILDEAQNTTPMQMKMFLTRFGFGSKVVVTGDITQIDLPKNTLSGLVHSLEVLKTVEDIGLVEFETKDVVRHGLVQKIVEAYARFID